MFTDKMANDVGADYERIGNWRWVDIRARMAGQSSIHQLLSGLNMNAVLNGQKYFDKVALLLVALFCFVCHSSSGLIADDLTDANKVHPTTQLIWEATGAIETEHIAPPLRAQMILHATQQLLPVRWREMLPLVREIQSPQDLQKWVDQIKQVRAETQAPKLDPQQLINMMLMAVPGRPQLVSKNTSRIDRQLSENRYVGIGIALSYRDDTTIVDAAFRGGPAYLGGIRPGDQIVKVNGRMMIGEPLGTTVQALRGTEGSPVSVVVAQPNQKPRTINMVRNVVPISSVKGVAEKGQTDWDYALPDSPQTAYVEITDISGSTAAELMNAARSIEKGSFTKVILDFRNCFKGDLHHVRMVADVLISGDRLGEWTDAAGKSTALRLRPQAALSRLPIVILVSPAQSNEIKFLIESLIRLRKCRWIGQPDPAPARVVSEVKLESGLGTLRGVQIGKLSLPQKWSEPLDFRSKSIGNVADRYRSTGSKRIDAAIRQAVQLD